VLLFIPFVFWEFFQIVRAISLAENRKTRLLRVGIWCIAFVLAFGILDFRARKMRQRADMIIAKIEAYREKHGTCPSTLEAIHESWENLRAEFGYSVYVCDKAGEPSFFYLARFGIDKHYYDFERKAWEVLPD
jgi:hypothetical protein